jgi:hypothetical protein
MKCLNKKFPATYYNIIMNEMSINFYTDEKKGQKDD